MKEKDLDERGVQLCETAMKRYNKLLDTQPKNLGQKALENCGDIITMLETIRASGLTQRGAVNFRQGNYEQTIADCSKALRLEHRDGIALDLRGEAHRQNKEFKKAAQDFKKAISIYEMTGDKDCIQGCQAALEKVEKKEKEH
jgi:tetratricopeptide (TPR) repeat protein